MAGEIGWIDLTTGDATGLRDFYAAVCGWRPEGVDMDGYQDYNMMVGDKPVAGICHARGPNAEQPEGWMLYVTVDDLDASVAAVLDGGGELLSPERSMGDARWRVIRDPAGGQIALYQE